ncbi:MAG: hypothetical protein PUK66_04510 [Bacteroidales bacterium]|uniref:hypothetical protein n=1 Tax=Porphyromonas sp. TaxID=1924944 RepID=UPI002972B1FB|nr:hypothetical protein [Porphyromonas sp.]MDD7438087.1 hypothetical protein [Bacteroidales bacterium]MDY3067403.1 hypothetical protein [Porphyromonas sp.]
MIHSKHIIPLLFVISLMLMSSCVADHPTPSDEEQTILQEGTPFEVSFGGFADGMSVSTLRASDSDPDQIRDLRLLVFDENHRFLYSRKAVLGAIVNDTESDANHLPDGKKDDIQKMMRFTTSLISSSRTRYIHFIANHDWSGFPQDYFIERISDGELIGGMITNKTEFWRMVKFDNLDASSFTGKVIKLLRNNAKVSVKISPDVTNFTYSGFTVHNAVDKATVAPFVFKEDLTYDFPITPDIPTVPAAITALQPKPFGTYDNGYDLFEMVNVSADKPSFVIMKGQLQGKREGYYKIDLVKLNPATGETSSYNVVRNYHYRIVVSHVANEGYLTPEEAARNPAGNNIFASIELADFPSVSDGMNTLEVDNLSATFVFAPSTFTTKVFYTGGIYGVKYYPSWDPATDEYLGALTRTDGTGGQVNSGSLDVAVKKVPTDRVLEYFVNVVAQDASGNIITRKISIFLRSPYSFNQSIQSFGSTVGSTVTISFDVPATMTISSIPFDVFIKTKELTPDLSPGNNDGMMLVQIGGDYYYRYRVKDATSIGKRIDLHFVRNLSYKAEVIQLTSIYYNSATVTLPS